MLSKGLFERRWGHGCLRCSSRTFCAQEMLSLPSNVHLSFPFLTCLSGVGKQKKKEKSELRTAILNWVCGVGLWLRRSGCVVVAPFFLGLASGCGGRLAWRTATWMWSWWQGLRGSIARLLLSNLGSDCAVDSEKRVASDRRKSTTKAVALCRVLYDSPSRFLFCFVVYGHFRKC